MWGWVQFLMFFNKQKKAETHCLVWNLFSSDPTYDVPTCHLRKTFCTTGNSNHRVPSNISRRLLKDLMFLCSFRGGNPVKEARCRSNMPTSNMSSRVQRGHFLSLTKLSHLHLFVLEEKKSGSHVCWLNNKAQVVVYLSSNSTGNHSQLYNYTHHTSVILWHSTWVTTPKYTATRWYCSIIYFGLNLKRMIWA